MESIAPVKSVSWHRAWTIALAISVAALGADSAYRAGVGRAPGVRTRTDLFVYLAASDALVAGRSPFGVTDEHGWPYVYPPSTALVFVPLRWLGRSGAAIAWYAISVSLFAAGIAALRRTLRPEEGGEPARDVALDVLLPLALVALPAASALERGQMGPALAGLLALGIARVVEAPRGASGRTREVAGGAAIGAAIALKVTPVLALVALALVRRPRALLGAAAALAALLFVGPALFLGARGAISANREFALGMGVRYAHDPGSLSIREGERDYAVYELPRNQSLLAVLYRAGMGGTRAFGPLAKLIAAAVAALALAPALARGGGARATPVSEAAALGLAAAASVLVTPVAWHHHHVVLYPALAAVATDALRPRAPRRGVLVALGVFGALELLYFAVPALGRFGLLGIGAIIPLALAARLALISRGMDARDDASRSVEQHERSLRIE